jgi:hypothetical protein
MTGTVEKTFLDTTDFVNRKINMINKSIIELKVEGEYIKKQNENN